MTYAKVGAEAVHSPAFCGGMMQCQEIVPVQSGELKQSGLGWEFDSGLGRDHLLSPPGPSPTCCITVSTRASESELLLESAGTTFVRVSSLVQSICWQTVSLPSFNCLCYIRYCVWPDDSRYILRTAYCVVRTAYQATSSNPLLGLARQMAGSATPRLRKGLHETVGRDRKQYRSLFEVVYTLFAYCSVCKAG